jgi:hypothetical protein
MRTRYAVGLLVTAATAIGVLGGPPSTAQADKATFKSFASIDGHSSTGVLTGAVWSLDENCKCSRGRRVTVWTSNPGAMDERVGTAKTSRGGRWKLKVTAPAGIYYATVNKRVTRRNGGHVCTSARSSNYPIP